MMNGDTPKPARWQVLDKGYQPIIQDMESKTIFAYVAISGFGVPASSLKLAEEVCEWLNTNGKSLK